MFGLAQRLKVYMEGFRRLFDQFSFDLRVASPGVIQSFDPVKQTVTVQIPIKEVIVIDGVKQSIAIPLLVDVPIVLPRAGGYVITFPVQAGDECLVVFGDTCIDSWWQNSGTVTQEPMSLRRHSLSDGFAILAPWSQPKVVSNYSEDSLQIRNGLGTIKIDVSELGIEIEAFENLINVSGESIDIIAPLINLVGETTNQAAEGSDTKIEVKADTLIISKGGSVITLNSGGISISAPDGVITIEGRDFLNHVHKATKPGEPEETSGTVL